MTKLIDENSMLVKENKKLIFENDDFIKSKLSMDSKTNKIEKLNKKLEDKIRVYDKMKEEQLFMRKIIDVIVHVLRNSKKKKRII